MEPDTTFTMQCIGGKTLKLPLNPEDRVADLRRLACQHMKCVQATLVVNGRSLSESDETLLIREVLSSNGTVLAAPARKLLQEDRHSELGHLLGQPDMHSRSFLDDDMTVGEPLEDDPAVAPNHASELQIRIGIWMERHKFPSAFLAVFYLLSLTQWSLFGLWMAGGPVAAARGFGALYMGISFVLLISMNLGRRKPGEASAYSVFNDGFRRLPGDFTDEQINNAFRGRM